MLQGEYGLLCTCCIKIRALVERNAPSQIPKYVYCIYTEIFPSASWDTCFLFRSVLELPNIRYKNSWDIYTTPLHHYRYNYKETASFYCPFATIDHNSVEKGTKNTSKAQVGFIVGFVILLHKASKLLHLHSRQQQPNAPLYSINHSHTLSVLPHHLPKCSQLLKPMTESCT